MEVSQLLKDFMLKQRIELMNGDQTPRKTSYLISLKAQQEQILSKTMMMIEQYALQFFEIFD